MHCPFDQTLMVAKPIGAYVAHRCENCSGIFLPGEVFREIRASAAFEAHRRKTKDAQRPVQHPSEIMCLNDSKPMMSLMFRGVEVDVCPQCFGIWLDHGEFEKISELIGFPQKPDLSKIGVHMGTIGTTNQVQDFDASGIGDVIELVTDVVGFLSDISP